MSEEYVELKDLSKRERAAKVNKYIAEKKAAFEAYKAKMRSKLVAARSTARRISARGKVAYSKVSKGLSKAQKIARKMQRRMPKRGGDDLFGFGSSSFGGKDELGMGSIFGSPKRRR